MEKYKKIRSICFFLVFLFFHIFFFCIFTPDFRVLSHNVTDGRVLQRIKTKDVHAEPSEAMQLQQGGHWVGIAGVTTFCRKAFTQRFIATIQTSNTWNPRSRCCNGRCSRDVSIGIPFRDSGTIGSTF